MGRTSIALVVSLAALCAVSAFVACNPTSLKPGYCHTSFDCTSDKSCDNHDGGTFKCIPRDGSMESMDARDGGDAEVPFNCNIGNDHCAADAGNNICDPDGGTCVECTMHDDCLAKNVNAPICQAQMCRACATDMECPDPKICLPDGHCATSGLVIYVDYTGTSCPGSGDLATPFCTLAGAMGVLTGARNVIVIRGPADDKLILNTTAVLPVIIGRKNSSGADASFPAGAGTAISVSSDQVLIRDVIATGGTAATSKGIVATGASTTLTLLNVTVDLTTDGLGIQINPGAELTMDHCTVTNNKRGGILLDTAQFLIKNTKVTYNGPGDDAGPWGGLRIKNVVTNEFLELVTVTNNNNVGISCTAAVLSNGVFASDNSGGLQVTGSCGITLCTQAGTTCGAQF